MYVFIAGAALLLLGCAGEAPAAAGAESDSGGGSADSGSTGGAAGEELPGAYEYEGGGSGGGDYDRAAIEQALDDVFRGALTLYPEPALQGYEAAMADGDAGCPSWYEVDGNTFWYASCRASSGASYDGYGFYYLYDGEDILGDGRLWDLSYLSGAATMVDAEGQSFHLGGYVYQGIGYGQGGDTSWAWVSAVFGSLAWDGESAAGTWLEAGVQPSLLVYGVRYPAAGASYNYIYLDGTIGGLSPAATAVELDELTLAPEALGWPCEGEPYGGVGLRDGDGVWWDVRFDVVLNETGTAYVLDGECDGCGAVFRGSELVGEACVDTSVLLDWEEQPW